jgi:DNA-binding PadR family transcriptional regulator
MIQSFMDIIILKQMKNGSISGYEMIKFFHKKFQILPSAGTIYSLLYSLERQKLIKGEIIHGKRTYRLTKHGEEFLRNILCARNHIQMLLFFIFSELKQ